MRPSKMEVNFEEMCLLEPSSCSRNQSMILSVYDKNYLRVNQRLLNAFKEMNSLMEMEIRHGKDYRIIGIRRDSSREKLIKFKADGTLTHPEFVNEFREMGYTLPARYIVEWNEKERAWIGVLQEVPEIKDVNNVIKNAAARRRKANGKV